LFFSIIKNFYEKYKFKIVTSSDFTDFVHERTCSDFTDFFNKFLYDTIPPVLKYKFSLVGDTLRFKYRWINVGRSFTMPFSIAINNEKNYRLTGTTEFQTFILGNVKSFYLPNEKRFKKDQITKNSFTYYWTSW
jgi:aminopeptidase N